MIGKFVKTITVNSASCIKGKDVAGFSATINSDEPINMNVSSWVNDSQAYKENISECRGDEEAFRKHVQGLQDEMLKEKENEK